MGKDGGGAGGGEEEVKAEDDDEEDEDQDEEISEEQVVDYKAYCQRNGLRAKDPESCIAWISSRR